MSPIKVPPVVLTGDRTTGPLHLGHYVGSLKSRLTLQENHRQYLLLADAQALTDNADDPGRVARNVIEVSLDYLAVGLDPEKSVICVQSHLPALAELTILYMNYVTVSRLERNPTVKQEIGQRGFQRDIPAGFLCYPVAQAADITAFKAELVPVGEDQLPMIEQSNEIVRRINRQAGREVLPEAQALVSSVGRLPGTDGRSKMSKSAGNAVPLSASPQEIRSAVHAMFTDPAHLRMTDPGSVEGNVVFTYLDAFDENRDELEELKAHYRRGGLGDVVLKRRLDARLQALLAPIRDRRADFAKRPDFVMDLVRAGTERAAALTQETLDEVRAALGLFRFNRG
ncbi:tryptophan--tRNA ligase [Mesorhizobium loti]|uniref:Tryptophan--tRNA ligase n=1 Tax=Rhizobium loti TaxID=381 RepID=A0A6M7U3W3_RHILI|nr:tryptophan--tRNA ligase [Mesorhizobium loti]OBQ62403.1 tryptophan--tRNA ligase [Mesorhizobium loti]QKC71326.1 tryptophan--tRNA ligase [Mesorhizobium loti]